MKLNSEEFKVKSLYDQELVMLKALSIKPNLEPFNSDAWLKKQLQTQIGHYSEIRHDNVLYLEECDGMCLMCEYADIMIEPCLEFWKEFLKLVETMKKLFRPSSRINNFSDIVKKFIVFTECFLNGK